MDFFDDLTAAVAADGARRGVRVDDVQWQQFLSRAPRVPAAEPPVSKTVPEPVLQFAPQVGTPVPEASPRFDRQSGAPAAPAQIAPQFVQTPPVYNQGVDVGALPGNLESLRDLVLNCRNCPLCQTRQNAVFGEGAPNARLMFIGEGPGADEDASGRPFVGAAGQLLDKMINAMHLRREDVYIANIVKCRPPGNRMPGPDEAAACIGYLHKQIELIKPEVIVLLGGTALQFLLNISGITRCRGRWFEFSNTAVMPTFHPAFLLRKPESKREAWTDLKMVMARLGIEV